MKTSKQFIEESKKIHNNKYDYIKVNYNGAHKKVCIICPKHGEFWQTPANHLQGKGCPKCKFDLLHSKTTKTTEDFIKKAKIIHGDKYDYSKVEYINSTTNVCIICPEHGEFWQTPSNHLMQHGCPKCAFIKNKDVNRSNVKNFIEKAMAVHGNRYDYSKVEYVNSKTKVCIICPKHGEFWQTPNLHLNGCGCPNCQQSRLENKTIKILDELSINYINRCDNKYFKWLGRQHLDFYLPDYNAAIECQGIQHYKPIKYFGGEKKYKMVKKLDEIKKKKILNNNIKLIYINYNFTNKKIIEIINKLKDSNY